MNTTLARKLGRSDIAVSAMGLGCWAIGGPFWSGETPVGWGEVDDEESIRAVHRGLELGINFFDTANVYGAGHSERVLARAFAGRRDQVVIATKFANLFDETTKQMTGSSAEPESIRQQCEDSLRRLNTDYIDLYQFHNGGYDLDRAGEVIDTLEALVGEGKIRWYGWSTDDPARAARFAQGAHCTSIQLQMNVLDDAPEMTRLCEAQHLAAILRGPLAMGILTGKYNASTTLPLNDVRSEKAPAWMGYFQHGKPNPILDGEARRGARDSHQRRTHLSAGRAGLVMGAQRTVHPDPRFPHGRAGRRKLRRAGARRTHTRPDD